MSEYDFIQRFFCPAHMEWLSYNGTSFLEVLSLYRYKRLGEDKNQKWTDTFIKNSNLVYFIFFERMKGFLQKVKNSAAVGVANLKEATGSSDTVPDDPAYLQISNDIKDASKKLEEIIKSFKDYSNYIEKYSSAQYTISGQFASLFKPEDPNYAIASSAHQQQEAVYTNSKNLVFYINKECLQPLKDLTVDLATITTAEKKRKRNVILLHDAEKDLQKAKDKGKVKDIAELQESVAKRQTKFTKYDNDFQTLSKQFLEKAPGIYAKSFNAYQFYIAQYFAEGKDKAIDSVPGFQYTIVKGELPAITVVPQQPEKTENK